MTVVTAEVTEQMIQRWRNQIVRQSGGHHQTVAEIDVNLAFCDLTGEIIGRVAFGTSNNQPEARAVVATMREMQKLGTAATMDPPILWYQNWLVYIYALKFVYRSKSKLMRLVPLFFSSLCVRPSIRYLPTLRNMRVKYLDRLLRTKIMAIMQKRVAAKCSGYGDDDLVGLLLEAWSPEQQAGRGETLTTNEVIDEWKTFFAAGQETTATLLVWAMFLLSVHPQWQDKVREEVLTECGSGNDGEVFNVVEVLGKLKLVCIHIHLVVIINQCNVVVSKLKLIFPVRTSRACSFTWFSWRRRGSTRQSCTYNGGPPRTCGSATSVCPGAP
jgi:cytochrome P450 family 709